VSAGVVYITTKWFGISLSHQDTVGATLPQDPTFGDRMWYTVQQIANNWPLKAIVFSTGFAGGWVIKGIADDVQVFLIQRRRRYGRPLGRVAQRLYPPAYVARYNEICGQKENEFASFSEGSTIGIKVLIALTVVFAVVGWFAVNAKLPHV
jgi:hypothetical protein